MLKQIQLLPLNGAGSFETNSIFRGKSRQIKYFPIVFTFLLRSFFFRLAIESLAAIYSTKHNKVAARKYVTFIKEPRNIVLPNTFLTQAL